MRRISLLAPLLFALACGDEGTNQDGDIYDHPPNPLPSVDHVNVAVNPAEFPHHRFSDIQKPYEDSAGCLAYHSGLGDTSLLTTCRCNNCMENMQECDALKGCQEIRTCSIQGKCDSELTCYLFPGAPCVEVIDRWGNASVAVTVSVELMKCSKSSKCQ